MGSHRTGWIHGCLALGPLFAAALIAILMGTSCGDDDDNHHDDRDLCASIDECADSLVPGTWDLVGYELVGEEDCEASGIHVSVPRIRLTSDRYWVVAELNVTLDHGGPYFLRTLGADYGECSVAIDGTQPVTYSEYLQRPLPDDMLVVIYLAPQPRSCHDPGPFACAFEVRGMQWGG